ncbi:MAG: hypothetical protein RLZZ488_1838 [Pseudomonadota bacterium]
MIHHWDFFGPDAEKTAEHFKKHFAEFCTTLAVQTLEDGFFSAAESHVCFWVAIEGSEHSQLTKDKLRPRRSLSLEEHQSLVGALTGQS